LATIWVMPAVALGGLLSMLVAVPILGLGGAGLVWLCRMRRSVFHVSGNPWVLAGIWPEPFAAMG
jgi:hypothetical protein